ncbi:uncharacterized protein ACR2FA_010035 [Aphomia sociella]
MTDHIVDSNDDTEESYSSDEDEHQQIVISEIEEHFPHIYVWSNINTCKLNGNMSWAQGNMSGAHGNMSGAHGNMSQVHGNMCEVYRNSTAIENEFYDGTVYTINGDCYKYGYRPFERYQTVNMIAEKLCTTSGLKNDADDQCALRDDDDGNECEGDENASDNDAAPPYAALKITLQKVPHGVIINDNVYLTDNQWNTLYLFGRSLRCFVCGEVPCALDDNDHILSEAHKSKLQLCEPLEKFDLSITRKMLHKYHCGVCNEVYDTEDIDEHSDSKNHETNQLFYINKASDIIFDHNVHDYSARSNDCYHFDAKTINHIHYESCNSEITNDSVTTNETFDNENEDNDDVDSDNGNENNDSFMGMSYAAMTKKPKAVSLPKHVHKVSGNKRFKLTSDSWHMILNLKDNEFYCMVCKCRDHTINKSRHCMEFDHVYNLNKCHTVDGYTDYLIRQVDDTKVHCAHCNNLEYKYQIDVHLKRRHPKLNTSETPSTSAATDINNERTNSINGNDRRPNENRCNDNLKANDVASSSTAGSTINERNITNDSLMVNALYRYVPLKWCGVIMNVKLISLNVVCLNLNHFYCGLCDINDDKRNVLFHINHNTHKQYLQAHSFIPQFGCHLIRDIRGAFHCTLCNMPISKNAVYINNHIRNYQHLQNFNMAFTNNKNSILQNADQHKVNPLTAKGNEKTYLTQTGAKCVAESANAIANATEFQMGATGVAENKNTNDSSTNKTEMGVAENKYATAARTNAPSIVKNKNAAAIDTNKTGAHGVDENEKFTATRANKIGMGAKSNNTNAKGANESELAVDKDDSFEIEKPFDVDAMVYVQLKGFWQITLTSYNSLVSTGSGARFCFICNIEVEFEDLKRHVDSRTHNENMNKYKFIRKYENNLIRQYYLTYHCAICNVILFRSELSSHFQWPPHNEIIQKNASVSKNQRKSRKKSGIQQFTLSVQDEQTYLNVKEPRVKYHYNIIIKDSADIVRKNKIVIVQDVVWKIQWDAWNSFLSTQNGYKCILCRQDVGNDLYEHTNDDIHKRMRLETFVGEYYPSLVRKIDNELLNCVICNKEVPYNEQVIDKHIYGKRHLKNCDELAKESSRVNAYEDCEEDVLTL